MVAAIGEHKLVGSSQQRTQRGPGHAHRVHPDPGGEPLEHRARLQLDRDSELAAQQTVHLHDGVVAEQGGCDARGRRRRQRRGDLVGREDVLVRARPVGQQRARDGCLRLRVLRACRPVVGQQRVHLRRGVVGQQRSRNGAGRLGVLRRPRSVVDQQRVHLLRGVVGQQRSREGRVRRRDGVAVGRDAQRVVAAGQRSRERSLQMQVANDAASANELPSREARPGRRVNNSAAAGKLQGGELREDCVEGALERGLAG